MSDYPPDFIDTIRAKAAMGWADEHEVLLQEIDKLTDMLKRTVYYCENNIHLYLLRMLDEDIQEWWQAQKDKK